MADQLNSVIAFDSADIYNGGAGNFILDYTNQSGIPQFCTPIVEIENLDVSQVVTITIEVWLEGTMTSGFYLYNTATIVQNASGDRGVTWTLGKVIPIWGSTNNSRAIKIHVKSESSTHTAIVGFAWLMNKKMNSPYILETTVISGTTTVIQVASGQVSAVANWDNNMFLQITNADTGFSQARRIISSDGSGQYTISDNNPFSFTPVNNDLAKIIGIARADVGLVLSDTPPSTSAQTAYNEREGGTLDTLDDRTKISGDGDLAAIKTATDTIDEIPKYALITTATQTGALELTLDETVDTLEDLTGMTAEITLTEGVVSRLLTSHDSFVVEIDRPLGGTFTTGNSVKIKTDFASTRVVNANILQISGDTIAADNLEKQYDTTGLSGVTFPASQGQIGTPANIDGGGATIADNLKKLADDNGGLDFIAGRDSLNAVRSRGDLAWLTGAGSVAVKTYNNTSIVRTVGDDDGGVADDVDVVDGTYFATGEINSGLRMVVDVTFTADDGAENPVELLMWGFYNGGGTHHINVEAYNYKTDNYELIGEIANMTVVVPYRFSLNPDHIDTTTGAVAVKFSHDPPTTGNVNHVFNIDKIVATTATTSITAVNIEFIKNVEEADVRIDKTTTPWNIVKKIKATATELTRKAIKDENAADITDINTVIGQEVEP